MAVMPVYQYRADQELPAIAVEWKDRDGAVIDFSAGWTFTAKVAARTAPDTVLLSKTSGISGSASSPNVLIDWSTVDFSGLTSSASGTVYVVHLYARRTADSKDRVFRPGAPLEFVLFPAPA